MSLQLKKPAQYDAVVKALNTVLGPEHRHELAMLALYICKETCPQPLPEILMKLFHDGCSVTRLLAALLRCESLRMQALFTGHAKMPLHTQFEDLRHMVHDFNGLQDAVMEVGERYLAETSAKTIRNLDMGEGVDVTSGRISGYVGMSSEEIAHHRKNVLLASMIEWTKNRSARIHNIYRGIPVNTSAEVLASEGETIRIRLDRDVGKVFASHPLQNCAYLSCAGGEDQIQATLLKVGKGEVTLTLGDISPSFFDRRGDLGVQVAGDVPVEILSRGRKIGTVDLFDASVSGLGFILHESDEAPYSAGDEIECRFKLGSKDIRAIGWIRWLQAYEGGTRIGMELKSDKPTQQVLQREIFRIQREIIVAINELEMPEALKEAIR